MKSVRLWATITFEKVLLVAALLLVGCGSDSDDAQPRQADAGQTAQDADAAPEDDAVEGGDVPEDANPPDIDTDDAGPDDAASDGDVEADTSADDDADASPADVEDGGADADATDARGSDTSFDAEVGDADVNDADGDATDVAADVVEDAADPDASMDVDAGATETLIFSDGFESGDTSAWDATVSGYRMTIATEAARSGMYGMLVERDTSGGFGRVGVTHWFSEDYATVRAVFSLNLNARGLDDRPSDTTFRLLELRTRTEVIAYLEVLAPSDAPAARSYSLRLTALTDSGEAITLGAFEASDGVFHRIGVAWGASSSEGADDGFARLMVDDVVIDEALSVDNDAFHFAQIRLGNHGQTDAWISTMYLDDVEVYGQENR